jgi:hypothetical protein
MGMSVQLEIISYEEIGVRDIPATFAQPSRGPNFSTVCLIHDCTVSSFEISTTHVQYRSLASGNSASISAVALARSGCEAERVSKDSEGKLQFMPPVYASQRARPGFLYSEAGNTCIR